MNPILLRYAGFALVAVIAGAGGGYLAVNQKAALLSVTQSGTIPAIPAQPFPGEKSPAVRAVPAIPAKKAVGRNQIQVITPNGGEKFVQGKGKIAIKWSGGTEKVMLALMSTENEKYGVDFINLFDQVIAENLPPEGTLEWDGLSTCYGAGHQEFYLKYYPGMPEPGCQSVTPSFYKILAITQNRKGEPISYETLVWGVDAFDSYPWDKSDSLFMIVADNTPTAIKLIQPKGGETFKASVYDPSLGSWTNFGSLVNYRWELTDAAGNAWPNPKQLYSINFYKGSAYVGRTGFWHQYPWSEMQLYMPDIPPGDNYTAEIVFHGPNGDIKDKSDIPFSITAP